MERAPKRLSNVTPGGRWALIVVSYALAALNYFVNHLPWGVLPKDLLVAISHSA